MNRTDNDMDQLQAKRDILVGIRENTAAQSAALTAKDEKALGRLLKERQKLIEKLAKIGADTGCVQDCEKNAEILEAEKSIQSLLREICRMNDGNMQAALLLKEEYGKRVAHIKTGKNAIRNGYFKRQEPLYGCFVDRKVGSTVKGRPT